MSLYRRIAFILATLLLASCARETAPSGGISQLIEERNGQRGVSGVEITLRDSRFPATLPMDQLHVTEEKHGTDVTAMMTWSVSEDRRRLSVRFKPGFGDFGTGNSVTVTIARGALSNYHQANDPQWEISTDPF